MIVPAVGNTSKSERLRVAVQKSGRLSDSSIDLLERCGVRLRYSGDRLLARSIDGLPMDVFLVRDDDITGFVDDGVCDIGIVGENVYRENLYESKASADLEIVKRLGFGRCRLCLATFNGGQQGGMATYMTKFSPEKKLRIATSYVGTVHHYMRNYKDCIRIVNMGGAVELAPRMDVADAVIDLVSTGASLQASGLEIVETLLSSEAVLLIKKGAMTPERRAIFERFFVRLEGVIRAKGSKYVMMHIAHDKVAKISELFSEGASPTVLPLADQRGKVAVHIVSSEDAFWETIEGLKLLGAERILVLPIEKMLL